MADENVIDKKDWTIMVYMAGDNNLSRDMAYALQEIRDVAQITEGEVNLLAYFDSALQEVPTSYYDFTNYSDEFVGVRADETSRTFVSQRTEQVIDPNENSATAYSILNFIDWCVNKVTFKDGEQEVRGRKAKNYAFILSGHSFGFLNFGLFRDETSNYSMTLAKLEWAIGKEITKLLGQKLNILGFDSCVMSMLEVGYVFRDAAETLIASEGTIPNSGWTYRKLIEKITEQSKLPVKKLSKAIVKEFVQTHKNFTNGGVSIDLAAWDLVKINLVEPKLENFAKALIDCFTDEKSIIYKQLRRIILEVRWKCQPYMYDQNVDLIDFCKLLFDEIVSLESEFDGKLDEAIKPLKTSCEALIDSVKNCILISGFCGGTNQYSNGMSLFFPWTINSYFASLKDYTDLVFCKTKAGLNWNAFLFIYLTEVSYRTARDDTYEANKNKENLIGTEKFFFNKNVVKLAEDIINKIPPNIRDRIPPNIANRIPQNILDRIPPNIRDRIPPNIRDRIPPNIIDRGGMFGGMSKFMEQFVGYRNVATPWNISGLTLPDKSDLEEDSAS